MFQGYYQYSKTEFENLWKNPRNFLTVSYNRKINKL